MAIGAVLSQEGRLVALFSEKLNGAERRYSSYDLELYALAQALKKWRHYLLPKDFIVYIDNQALSFLNIQDKLSHKHIKWVESIKAYTFIIKHKKGQANKVVDALSKMVITVQEVQLQSVEIDCLKATYDEDEDFKEVHKCGWMSKTSRSMELIWTSSSQVELLILLPGEYGAGAPYGHHEGS
ncbi:uncharacterized protein LOC131874895 [Cryptomeria japonica]|uniref:uncharacterized protein LOC131874895 n=1 Tax=Cryptomeria japonica TaxID=3369 RepID=UPI0027DA9144|nr:uncharacterized protein LOC131874895 [Cryptomeria japonica]